MSLDKTVHVFGVPLDLGVSKLGVDLGPQALRYAGIFEAFAHAGFAWRDHGDLDVVRNFALDKLDPTSREKARLYEVIRVSRSLCDSVRHAAEDGGVPVVLGGDHSTSIGTVAGLAGAYENLGLLWIDAHPDANTPETSPSGNIHGMPLAVSLGKGFDELVNLGSFAPKVRPENVCIVGAKDVDPGELAFLKKHGVAMFTTFDIMELGINEVMRRAVEIVGTGTDGVHVSFDADVMDAAVAPGTGITTQGGLSYREISFVCQYIGKHLAPAGLDLIEVNPLRDKRNATAILCVELAMSMLGARYTDYEKAYLPGNLPQIE